MTNNELAALIRVWANRLQSEIEQLNGVLPEGMERAQTHRYIGRVVFPLLNSNPENWIQVDSRLFNCLAGLQGLLNDLYQTERILRKSAQEQK